MPVQVWVDGTLRELHDDFLRSLEFTHTEQTDDEAVDRSVKGVRSFLREPYSVRSVFNASCIASEVFYADFHSVRSFLVDALESSLMVR